MLHGVSWAIRPWRRSGVHAVRRFHVEEHVGLRKLHRSVLDEPLVPALRHSRLTVCCVNLQRALRFPLALPEPRATSVSASRVRALLCPAAALSSLMTRFCVQATSRTEVRVCEPWPWLNPQPLRCWAAVCQACNANFYRGSGDPETACIACPVAFRAALRRQRLTGPLSVLFGAHAGEFAKRVWRRRVRVLARYACSFWTQTS